MGATRSLPVDASIHPNDKISPKNRFRSLASPTQWQDAFFRHPVDLAAASLGRREAAVAKPLACCQCFDLASRDRRLKGKVKIRDRWTGRQVRNSNRLSHAPLFLLLQFQTQQRIQKLAGIPIFANRLRQHVASVAAANIRRNASRRSRSCPTSCVARGFGRMPATCNFRVCAIFMEVTG